MMKVTIVRVHNGQYKREVVEVQSIIVGGLIQCGDGVMREIGKIDIRNDGTAVVHIYEAGR